MADVKLSNDRIGHGYPWIAAGDYDQALTFVCNTSTFLNQSWRYLRDEQLLRGYHGIKVHIVGTFWERDDAQRLARQLRWIDADVTDLTDPPRWANPVAAVDAALIKLVRQELTDDLQEYKEPDA